jgi:hypothetical protein
MPALRLLNLSEDTATIAAMVDIPAAPKIMTALKSMVTFFLQNVRNHRWLPRVRLLPGDERAQAGGVTRVAIRLIALFGYFIDTLAHRAQQLVGGLRP